MIESIPIAGTRPKGGCDEELLNDPKEVAEHVMLVDLARNDVGAVSRPGTVQVLEFKKVHHFSHVMHIVSKVVGELKPEYDALDAFKASFPAGTLSGAPKVRAMELIDELETSRRGLYGGAIVAIDADGNLMSCIAIRTAVIKEGIATVRAGGGVVLDSEPQKEAEESRHKANTVLDALRLGAAS
jgi:anthranilate synthase component 1